MWKKILLACFLMIGLCGCKSQIQPISLHKWQYVDFRLFDPPDSLIATADILGIYLYQPTVKNNHAEINIRLDMLEVGEIPNMDLYLAVDCQAGGIKTLPIQVTTGIAWDWLIVIPASGKINILSSNGDNLDIPSVTILRDALLDTIEVKINLVDIDSKVQNIKVQSFTTIMGDKSLLDSTSIADIWKPPPPKLNVLFAFWDSFPAFTPAQSLRRWDGAHSGPFGGHHGLVNLIQSANNHQIPIFLLDIVNPVSLTALDYMHASNMLSELQRADMVTLSDSGSVYPAKNPYLLPDSLLENILARHQELRKDFNLQSSKTLYSSLTLDQLNLSAIRPYQIILLPIPENDPFVEPHWLGGHLVIPIPSFLDSTGALESPTPGFTNNELRAGLVAAGSQANADHYLFIIGGSLPNSEWGDPQIARSGFQYLKSRPWIRIASEADLLPMFQVDGIVQKQSSELITALNSIFKPKLNDDQLKILVELTQHSPNLSTTIAWNTILQLLSPANPDYQPLPELRSMYWAQVIAFNYIADWIESPKELKTCGELYLNIPTCTLASSNFFMIIDQQDGNILFAFFRDHDGLHQLIGPASQLASGLREPALWNTQRGIKAEPSNLGIQAINTKEPLPFETGANSLEFSVQPSHDELKYTLLPKSILIKFTGGQQFKIPLYFSLDPWLIHNPGWAERYHTQIMPDGWALWVDSGICIHVNTDCQVERYAFNDTQERMFTPENPNAEKKPGDFLPFPIIAGIFSSNRDFSVEIAVEEYCHPLP